MLIPMVESTATTRPQLREHTLVHFEIPASDPAKLARFYEQLLSWKFNKMPAGAMDYWMISHKDAAKKETMGGIYKRTMGETGLINYSSFATIDKSLPKPTGPEAK